MNGEVRKNSGNVKKYFNIFVDLLIYRKPMNVYQKSIKFNQKKKGVS